MSGKSSQRKGRAGELELSRILRGCGYDVQPGRAVSYGLPPIFRATGIHIECKRVERLNVPEAMKQAVRDAENSTMERLCHPRSREPWLVTMRLQDWMGLYRMQKDRPPANESGPEAGVDLSNTFYHKRAAAQWKQTKSRRR